jgi:branched-chain amino acid transport system permease protein
LGSLFAVFSVGIALVFGVMRLVNMGHATLILVASYALVTASGLPLPLQIAVALLVTVAGSQLVELVAFRNVRGKDDAAMLVTSFAVVIAGASIVEMLYGSAARSVDLGAAFRDAWSFGDVYVPTISAITIGVATMLLAALHLLLSRSQVGLRLRAVAIDAETAELLGVDVNRTIGYAFAVCGVLAGAAAVLVVGQSGVVTPTSGLNPVIFGLTAAIVGGLSSLTGAAVGGLALGAASQTLQTWLPPASSPYRDAILFGAVFVVLVVRPNGIIVRLGGERI